MLVSKTFVVVFFLCFVHVCLSKPATCNEVTESRGIMSSIWEWITYPFSWFSSEETKQPVTEKLLGSTTHNPNDIIDIRSHNVTIWCNDQICNTMKCDNTQCKNITCNIYDTDFRGECREYNITSSEDLSDLTVPKPTEANFPTNPTKTLNITSLVTNPQEKESNPTELEAVLSSTVNMQNLEKKSESKEDREA